MLVLMISAFFEGAQCFAKFSRCQEYDVLGSYLDRSGYVHCTISVSLLVTVSGPRTLWNMWLKKR